MRTLVITFALGLFTSTASGSSPAEGPKSGQGTGERTRGPRSATNATVVLLRGEKIDAAPNVTLADLLGAPESKDGKKVIVEGRVRRACQRRGCWMELANDQSSPGVRVTFKDYGFFVPTDSAGRQAKVAGMVKVVELSESAAAHYESEGGTIRRDSSGKPREVQLVASGVELRR